MGDWLRGLPTASSDPMKSMIHSLSRRKNETSDAVRRTSKESLPSKWQHDNNDEVSLTVSEEKKRKQELLQCYVAMVQQITGSLIQPEVAIAEQEVVLLDQ